MMSNIGNFGWWGMGLGPVFMLVFWVMVTAGIVAIVRLAPLAAVRARAGDTLQGAVEFHVFLASVNLYLALIRFQTHSIPT